MKSSEFSAAELLAATRGRTRGTIPDVSGVFTDSRINSPGKLFVALAGERFDAHDLLESAVKAGAAALCIDEKKMAKAPAGIPLLLVPDTLLALQALAGFHRRRFPGLVSFAVTGSVGKTSVKEMLRAIAVQAAGEESKVLWTQGNTNNQIGVPQNIFRLNSGHTMAVLEAGTNHFGEIRPLCAMIRPQVALVNSIAPCHLEFLRDLDGVATEKSEIFSFLSPDGCAVIPAECPQRGILEKAAGKHKILTFGVSSGDVRTHYLGGTLTGSRVELTFPAGKRIEFAWNLSGKHQALNAAAAAAAAYSSGIAPETIAAGLPHTELPGNRHRVFRSGGVSYIDDSYNANPAAMKAAIENLAEFADPAHTLLLLGEMRELGENSAVSHAEVRRFAEERLPGVRMILVGREFGPDALKDAAEAKVKLAELRRPGDTVLVKGSHGVMLGSALPEAEEML